MKRFKFYYNWDWYLFGFGLCYSQTPPSYLSSVKKRMIDVKLLWLNFYIIHTVYSEYLEENEPF